MNRITPFSRGISPSATETTAISTTSISARQTNCIAFFSKRIMLHPPICTGPAALP